MLKMECCLDSLKVKKFCRTELMSPDFDHQMNMIVGPFVVTQKKFTPFCDSNHHTEFCCIKMLLHGTTQRCNVETMLQQLKKMSQQCCTAGLKIGVANRLV